MVRFSCLEPDGRSNFNRLMFRRDWPFFYAFDVLAIDGRDVRDLPLVERKGSHAAELSHRS